MIRSACLIFCSTNYRVIAQKFLKIVWLSVIASAIGVLLVAFDIGAYFGSWFYLLLIAAVARKAHRWINLAIFCCINALAFGWATDRLWLGVVLASPAVLTIGYCVRKLYFQWSRTNPTETTSAHGG